MPEMIMPEDMALQYLDNNISHWRTVLKNSDSLATSEQATHYVDAYQSVRTAFFGELKPLEKWQLILRD